MVVLVNYLSKESEIVHVCKFLTLPQAFHELFLAYNNCVSRNTIIVLMYNSHKFSYLIFYILNVINPVIYEDISDQLWKVENMHRIGSINTPDINL
jgi:hypothetical protein